MRVLCWLWIAVGWAGLAGAVEADQVSTDRSEATPVWLRAGAVNHQRDPLTRDCQWVPAEPASSLPAGLRVLAHVATARCGETYLVLDLPVEIYGEHRASVAWSTLDAVSLTPPATDPWRDAPVVRPAFLKSYRHDGYTRVAPITNPDWIEPLRLGPGEPIGILDEELAVIRTAAGQTAVLSPWWIDDVGPSSSGDLGPYYILRARFVAGRALHESSHPLQYLPPAETLRSEGDAVRGRAFEFGIEPEWMSQEQFEVSWLDPVGQVLDHECDPRRTRDGEPCGAYYLDYAAFGAWWPNHDLDVVAVSEGTREVEGRLLPVLRVLVREPWSRKIEVSPSWDRP